MEIPKLRSNNLLRDIVIDGMLFSKIEAHLYQFFKSLGFDNFNSFDKALMFLEDLDDLKLTILNTTRNELKTISGVYLITNHISGNIYIGSSINCRERRYHHFYCLSKRQYKTRFQVSFDLHGINNFTFCLLEVVENEQKLREREQFYIDTLRPVFNSKPNVDSNSGYKHRPESIQKMKDKKKGKSYHSKEQIDKLKKRWEDPEWRLKHTESIRNYYKNKDKNG